MAKKPTAAPKGDKLGQFEIPMDLLKDEPDLCKRIFGECIILRAEFIYATNSVIYHAWHDEFDERELGTDAPKYDPNYDQESDTLTWTKTE